MKLFIYALLVVAMITGIWYGQSLFWAISVFAFFGVFTVGFTFFLLNNDVKNLNYTHMLFWVLGGLFLVFAYMIIFYHNMPLINIIVAVIAIIGEYILFKAYFKKLAYMPLMIGYPSCFVLLISVTWIIAKSCGCVLREDGPVVIMCLILILAFIIISSADYLAERISQKCK